MIEKVIEDWHLFLKGELAGGLDTILADDVVFYSPVVFTPQRGKELTKVYLNAAAAIFAEVEKESDKFHYTKQTFATGCAILEFEATVEGKYINGVDIISASNDAKISEFRVMIRPLQAVNMMHQRMLAMLG